jgi:hypothetical protein
VEQRQTWPHLSFARLYQNQQCSASIIKNNIRHHQQVLSESIMKDIINDHPLNYRCQFCKTQQEASISIKALVY